MTKELFNDRVHALMAKVLDLTSERHRVLANNVANVDTPGFQRSDIRFDRELADALRSRSPNALRKLRPTVVQSKTAAAFRNDGNNVDMDTEMGEMAKNFLLYNVNAQLISKRLAMLRAAISGRP